jgi:hypothetical protein
VVRVAGLAQLVFVLRRQPGARAVGDDADGAAAAPTPLMNARAMSSSSKPCTRSSVDLSVRETSEVKTIVAMKIDAILMPSGRSTMLVNVV